MPGLNGLVIMKPTSIASTGTGNSSSIGTNGKVTFSSCDTLSLNGVFTSSYDNYMISMRSANNAGDYGINIRMRSAGTDNSTASSYTWQFFFASGTTATSSRSSDSYSAFFTASSTRDGNAGFLFGPFLTQPTAGRSSLVYGTSSGAVLDYAIAHTVSASYDGITFFPVAGQMTGAVTIYGFNQ